MFREETLLSQLFVWKSWSNVLIFFLVSSVTVLGLSVILEDSTERQTHLISRWSERRKFRTFSFLPTVLTFISFLVSVMMVIMILRTSPTNTATYHFLSPFLVPPLCWDLLHAAPREAAHFTAKETEAQGAWVTCSGSHIWKAVRVGAGLTSKCGLLVTGAFASS